MQCLKGRRVIFLGDSLSNQQADSLLGMLGWHPEWMTAGAPRNAKLVGGCVVAVHAGATVLVCIISRLFVEVTGPEILKYKVFFLLLLSSLFKVSLVFTSKYIVIVVVIVVVIITREVLVSLLHEDDAVTPPKDTRTDARVEQALSMR